MQNARDMNMKNSMVQAYVFFDGKCEEALNRKQKRQL